MKLGELAFACHVYSYMIDYDSSFSRLLSATKPRLDLHHDKHIMDLLKWLNDWGCRQFAKKDHPDAAREIKSWYGEFAEKLVPKEKTLISLSEDDLKGIESAYSNLCSKIASNRRSRNGKISPVVVGPTGTAKILFALRPNSLIPWDEAIRKKFRLDGTANSYSEYLRKAKNLLEELSKDCKENGFELSKLPQKLNRLESSPAKLIDEFYWVTVSRKCLVPSKEILQQWISWM
jgi:hypothetical protein